MSELFGKKKPKHPISKSDLKESLVKANDSLRKANIKLKEDVKRRERKFKSLLADYTAHEKALEDLKDMQKYAKHELNSTQLEIVDLESSAKSMLDNLSSLSSQEKTLEKNITKLTSKEVKLSKSLAILEAKKVEAKDASNDLEGIRKAELDGQNSLDVLYKELNQLKADTEVYMGRKSVLKSEFDTFKGEIEREKRIAEEQLREVSDLTESIDSDNNARLSNLDHAIADRLSELKDMDDLGRRKEYEAIKLQSKISLLEDQVKDAEDGIAYAVRENRIR